VWCCSLVLDDGVVTLRLGAVEVGSVFLVVCFAGGDRLGRADGLGKRFANEGGRGQRLGLARLRSSRCRWLGARWKWQGRSRRREGRLGGRRRFQNPSNRALAVRRCAQAADHEITAGAFGVRD
jgi:hypothetical protein